MGEMGDPWDEIAKADLSAPSKMLCGICGHMFWCRYGELPAHRTDGQELPYPKAQQCPGSRNRLAAIDGFSLYVAALFSGNTLERVTELERRRILDKLDGRE